MGDSESALPATKKRVAGRQISKENPELDDDGPEPDIGTFQKASDKVLATRRIVKVRRSQPSAASSNPFAALRMVPPDPNAKATNPSAFAEEKKVPEVKDGADEINIVEEENKKVEEKTDLSSSKDDAKLESDTVEEAKKDVKHVGTEEENKKVEEKTDLSSSKDDAKLESDAVEEAKKDVKHVGTDEETREETQSEEVKETEKKDASEETESDNAHGENNEKEKVGNNNEEKVASLSSFQQLSSSQNAFTGLSGTGFGKSSFSFGSIAKDGPAFGTSSGSIFGTPFGDGNFKNGNLSAPSVTKGGLPPMQEVPIETGEENEKAVFTADAILYEYLDGGWKERGKGELKLNTSVSGEEKARLVMRARGNYRLILNASLYPDMTLASMEKKGVTFACVNSAGEGKNGLATFALKFKDSSFMEEFRVAVTEHKGKKATVLKTPKNSPKASDESDLV